jgi:very-short-patch-repair endonuclease
VNAIEGTDLMSREFSTFKSAIDWRDYRDEVAPTGELKPFGIGLLKAVEAAAESFAMAAETESPIETIFGAQLALVLRPFCKEIGWEFSVGTEDDDIVLHPQFSLARFRYDFAVRAKWKLKPLVLVECDGKEFHSSADDQANDKLKDEAASRAGIRLIRFTGSEIHRDVDTCVKYAMSAIINAAVQ